MNEFISNSNVNTERIENQIENSNDESKSE